MTYHYRIYTFKNGLGETVFRAKPVHRFWPQRAVSWVGVWNYSGIFSVRQIEWKSRDGATAAIEAHAKDQERIARHAREKTIKLVIVEDESVEVQ